MNKIPMPRKLFCQISPFTYNLSVKKCRLLRKISDALTFKKIAKVKSDKILPQLIYRHSSLIRRRLGNVRMDLQENKAVNLSIAAPKVNKILIRPGEVFSFWNLVGFPSEKAGYKPGLSISDGKAGESIAGGMCQFTNLIHWMVLHSPLTIVEHHHHDGIDMFPDFNRQVPFGTGTSIFYNYLDYRFKNETSVTFQLITYTTDKYLCGELRAEQSLDFSYHIFTENEGFIKEEAGIFRIGQVYRKVVDKKTGNTLDTELIRNNHARVMYEIEL